MLHVPSVRDRIQESWRLFVLLSAEVERFSVSRKRDFVKVLTIIKVCKWVFTSRNMLGGFKTGNNLQFHVFYSITMGSARWEGEASMKPI